MTIRIMSKIRKEKQNWSVAGQKRDVLRFFKEHPFDEFTAPEVQEYVLPHLASHDVFDILTALQEEDEEIYETKNQRQNDMGTFYNTWKKEVKYNYNY